jgi:hypothetical protein
LQEIGGEPLKRVGQPAAHEAGMDRPSVKKWTKYLTNVVFMPQRNAGYWSDKGSE